MSHLISIDFTSTYEFLQKFEDEKQNNPEFDILVVNYIPSVLKSFELILQPWFKTEVCEHKNLIGIVLRINENIEKNFNFGKFDVKKSSLITFQSMINEHESKTFWRSSKCNEVRSVYIDDDENEAVSLLCREFLVNQIKIGESGTSKKFKNKKFLHVHELGDSHGKNLLQIAIKKHKASAVDALLKHFFEPDDVIDLAWKRYVDAKGNERIEADKVFMSLLMANSKFPKDFDYDKASDDVQEFVMSCEGLHEDVDSNNFEDLKEKLKNYERLTHFYNRHNVSLLAHAINGKKFKIFEFLNNGISINGNHENLKVIYGSMKDFHKRMLRKKHMDSSYEFPEVHLLILKSMTKIGNNVRLSPKHWLFVDEAYKFINKNKLCSKILKIAAECRKVKIFFDFKHDSTYYLDPATGYYTQGIFYIGQTIIVGVKNLTDDVKKFKVFGVIAHELCHLAISVAFMNANCDPFPLGESRKKTRYHDEVMKECEVNKEKDEHIRNVFKSYEKIDLDSEMIVTIPEMLMAYSRNKGKIDKFYENFKELNKYIKEVVEPELVRALKIIKVINDDERKLKFAKLTEPMKAKIQHSQLKFQNEISTFHNLIGNDSEILKHLTSEHIRKILMKNKILEFGEVEDIKLEHDIVDRTFIESEELDKIIRKERIFFEYIIKCENHKKDFHEIQSEVKSSKIFLLADHAGSGKTTTFWNSAKKVKNENKNFWVSYIKLRNFKNIFEKFNDKLEVLNFELVVQILYKMVQSKSIKNEAKLKIESKIFRKLFLEGKVVLFLDGVDEVCPKYNELIMKILKILKESETKNQFWISTRPHYGEKLKEIFKVPVFRFSPYTEDEQGQLIVNILEFNKIYNEDKQRKISNAVSEILVNLGMTSSSKKSIDNPLIIKMITKLCIQNPNMNYINNIYQLYSETIKMQKEEIGEKIPNEDRDLDLNLKIWEVHQVLALKDLVDGDFWLELNMKYKVDDFVIVKIWENEKQHWTSDIIQRYGFVNIDLDCDTESIDFVHRTYSEFFIAKLIVESIFDIESFKNGDEEMKKIFQLLHIMIAISGSGIGTVPEFIFSYIKNERPKDFHRVVKTEIIETIEEIHELITTCDYKTIHTNFEYFAVYAKLIINNDDLQRKLWKLDEENDIIKEIVLKEHTSHYDDIARLAKEHFGLDWHQKLNKSSQKLLTDEEINDLMDDDFDDDLYFRWENDKNLLKLFNLVEKNYNEREQKIFYNNFQLYFIDSFNIMKKIFSIMKKSLESETLKEKVSKELTSRNISYEDLVSNSNDD